jgi:hypothetical protein
LNRRAKTIKIQMIFIEFAIFQVGGELAEHLVKKYPFDAILIFDHQLEFWWPCRFFIENLVFSGKKTVGRFLK